MLQSINPYTLETLTTHPALTAEELEAKIQLAQSSFLSWRESSFAHRREKLQKLGQHIGRHIEDYARLASLEMGKPVQESRAELKKCTWLCDFYAEKAIEFLQNETIGADAAQSWVSYEPLGAVLAVMPWNYPWWQVLRFAAPALMAGNVGLLKHAPNVQGTAHMIEEAFAEAGFPEGTFQNLPIEVEQVPGVIAHPVVKAVTLTGSGRAGSAVAALAGKAIKKQVLELGGSNAFIVLDDADLDRAVQVGLQARMQNNGQSCIAAKRFFLQKGIAKHFIECFRVGLEDYIMGNPLDEASNLGPLARVDLAEELERQVRESIEKGAQLISGGNRAEAFFEPTLLSGVKPGMPAFDEELFGPVAAVCIVEDLEEAISLSNLSTFGLGASIFTSDIEQAVKAARNFEDGAVFINDLVKSDPRLPFGGTKASGYGRELSLHGIREFCNAKTIYVRH